MDDLNIGDFSKPVTPKPPAAPQRPAQQAVPPPPTKIPTSPDEVALGVEASAVEAELAPMRTYEDTLREAGVTREEAARIVDAVMERGFWSEAVQITRSTTARLRTRTSRDRTRAMERVEIARPSFDAHYYDLMNKLLLAASLEAFGKIKFEHPGAGAKPEDVEKAFETRFAFVDAVMAEPAYALLLRAFLKFDEKVRVVTAEGVVENF
jgi:hypothetical protein